MESTFSEVSRTIALLIEAGAAIIISIGAAEALYGSLRAILTKGSGHPDYRTVYLRFGSRLILGLEFALAADIVRTAIAPSWNDIGQLAAVAAIRTFLNFFLERDIERFSEEESESNRPENS